MKIGSSIALIVIGLILIFAVQDLVTGVDLAMIGYILVAGGVIGLIATLVTSAAKRPKPLNHVSETRTLNDPNSGESIRRTEVRED
jgi:hypothetical protein